MTTFKNKEHVKRISIRSKAIHSIAVLGQLSKSRAVKTLGSYNPNIHDAFRELEQDKIIESSYVSFKRRGKPERFFKLTAKGLSEFIDQVPSPSEFTRALIWFCGLNKGNVKEHVGIHMLKNVSEGTF